MSPQPRSVPRCRHIKVNGVQCGSPALARESYCFFHNRWREQSIELNNAEPQDEIVELDFPVLEDARSIQVALMQVMRLVLARKIDSKTAGLLLYGLQTAASILKQSALEAVEPREIVTDPAAVEVSVLSTEQTNPYQFDRDSFVEGYEEERDFLMEERLRRQASALSGTPMPDSAELPPEFVIERRFPEDLEVWRARIATRPTHTEDGRPIGLMDLLPGGRRGAMMMFGRTKARRHLAPKAKTPAT